MTRSDVSFASVTAANSGTVRKLNSVLFPIRYSEKFYKDIVAPELENFCKLVYFNDIPVGTICCRIDKGDHEGEGKLYLMTMGILAPYRSRQLGTKALEEILAAATSHKKPQITCVRLHVQENNEDARRFYERHGFTAVGKEPEYYKKIEPHGAWILEKKMEQKPTS
ncbi:acyl-CoA N-acyltransferase [Hysterangium stoloniferum]|nr:acyl-CoA N-acyltransferase [Hysterangium stoloniferum]